MSVNMFLSIYDKFVSTLKINTHSISDKCHGWKISDNLQKLFMLKKNENRSKTIHFNILLKLL